MARFVMSHRLPSLLATPLAQLGEHALTMRGSPRDRETRSCARAGARAAAAVVVATAAAVISALSVSLSLLLSPWVLSLWSRVLSLSFSPRALSLSLSLSPPALSLSLSARAHCWFVNEPVRAGSARPRRVAGAAVRPARSLGVSRSPIWYSHESFDVLLGRNCPVGKGASDDLLDDCRSTSSGRPSRARDTQVAQVGDTQVAQVGDTQVTQA